MIPILQGLFRPLNNDDLKFSHRLVQLFSIFTIIIIIIISVIITLPCIG